MEEINVVRIIVNVIVMALTNTTVFLSLLGPLLFNIAFNKAQKQASKEIRKKRGKKTEFSQAYRDLATTEEGQTSYGLMEFSIHYYTLIASLIALVIASWAIGAMTESGV